MKQQYIDNYMYQAIKHCDASDIITSNSDTYNTKICYTTHAMTHSIIFYIILLHNISLNLLVLQSASQHNNLTCKTIIQFARSSSAIAEGFQQNSKETIIVNMHITNVKITKLHSNNGLRQKQVLVCFSLRGENSQIKWIISTPLPPLNIYHES